MVVMNVRYDTGLESKLSYHRYLVQLGFLIVVTLLVSALWQGSFWLFILGVVLGSFWIADFRAYRKWDELQEERFQHRQRPSRKSVEKENKS